MKTVDVSPQSQVTKDKENVIQIRKIEEKLGTTGILKEYKIDSTKNHTLKFLRKKQSGESTSEFILKTFFREAFLPQGYPKSVSRDYTEYQIYDTIQAFCSRITGTLTTKAVLTGVGVGDATATPLAAAITWIFKDGAGMICSILFAWSKGTSFDYDCKKWRFFADILNDIAMFFEMLLPYFDSTTTILCLTTAMKAGVGVCGSATRAAIMQHQAIKNNMADVAAKDGSQETAVNLIASVFAIFILTTFNDDCYNWPLFIIFTILHLYANFRAVKCLRFHSLNKARLILLVRNYLTTNKISQPKYINMDESVVIGCGVKEEHFCGFKITLGESVEVVLDHMNNAEFQDVVRLYSNSKYIIVPNLENLTISVILFEYESAEDVIWSYFHALVLAISFGLKNNFEMHHLEKHTDFKSTYFGSKMMKILQKLPQNVHEDVDVYNTNVAVFNYLNRDLIMKEIKLAGWRTDMHSIDTKGWRTKLAT